MSLDPIHAPQRQPDDPDPALRPKSLGEFVRQEAARLEHRGKTRMLAP